MSSNLMLRWKTIRFPWRRRILVGVDQYGNQYYETTKPDPEKGYCRRKVEPIAEDVLSYNTSKIPVQWHSWLRYTRVDPPTVEEILLAEKKIAQTVQRAHILDQKWQQRKLQIEQEAQKSIGAGGDVPQETSAASSASAEPIEKPKKQVTKKPIVISPEPAGQGDTFEPGSWVPSSRR
ncbi:hypothetical protein K493DRAFT_313463 [Basidiobolus meristosporus CBS 931.73]|uniref:NADH dehydrogenase [ubiquinone] 1 alpha subcomplex subunit n=1 Tax=Basidiobolus meristosporus CBS 931.73 TaxID=1314790 RepID=A0A1Y1YLE6_9FUNG|nr:hypothetical protein K493DRAFT_313463 [Basidiobolus meristosporus CBS 931.73]|eukprot:ORX98837.1 hypothetical protein K493DRAFT_313463 [Basidiobolus meristosporus CBS 931.73]